MSRCTTARRWACGEALGDLPGDRQRVIHRQRARREPIPQAAPLDERHRDVGAAVCLTRFVHRADVRTVECGGRLGLAQEPGPRRGRRGQLGGQELERHGPPQVHVFCEPDDAHAPAAEFTEATVSSREEAGGVGRREPRLRRHPRAASRRRGTRRCRQPGRDDRRDKSRPRSSGARLRDRDVAGIITPLGYSRRSAAMVRFRTRSGTTRAPMPGPFGMSMKPPASRTTGSSTMSSSK